MAEVIWNKQAENEWRQKLLYGLDEFGQSTSIRFVQRTNDIVNIIRKHPKAGLREPLLRHKKKDYRYFHLVGSLKQTITNHGGEITGPDKHSPCEHWVLRLGLRINKKQIEKYNLAVSFSFCNFAPEMNKNLYIISGCNGAGKTTASYIVLPEILDCKEFVNADEIARGLSPFT